MKRFSSLTLCALAAACGGDSGTAPQLGAPPVLTALAPATGTVGTEVRIDGTGFDAEGVTVFFDDFESPQVVLESGALFATAPVGLSPDASYTIRVLNRSSAADTLIDAFSTVAPNLARVNGVTKPTGLVGMLVFIEKDAFGDAANGQVYFRATDGTRIQAAIADSANDWTNSYIVTTVPTGTADSSMIWVETATGVDSISFNLIQNGVFSPSTINWTQTADLPQPLQGLGALFVPVEFGATPANYVYVLGGADSLQKATTSVYRATVQQSGALGAWDVAQAPLPVTRAYHAVAGATAYTAEVDTTVAAAYLYVIGGRDSTGATLSEVTYASVGLDGQIGSWTATTPLPAALHSMGAVVFRGFLYVAGGADASDVAQAQVYRAPVLASGGLGAWETMTALSTPRAYFSLVSFGPYLYAIGGESGTATPVQTALSGTETSSVGLARINLRTGAIGASGWESVSEMAKARSKHGAVFAGGSLFVSSGLYSGIGVSGSSENSYATLNSDGTLGGWNGATNAETMNSEIGYSLYNQAMVTFIDDAGTGHVLVIGGARTSTAGAASAKVLYY